MQNCFYPAHYIKVQHWANRGISSLSRRIRLRRGAEHNKMEVTTIKEIITPYVSTTEPPQLPLDDQDNIQSLILNLAARFMNVIPHNYYHVLTEVFETVGKKLEADYLSLYFYDFQNKVAVKTYQWSVDGTVFNPDDCSPVKFEKIVDIMKLHLQSEITTVDFNVYPSGQTDGIGCFLRKGIQFLSLYPLVTRGQRIGFIIFEKTEQKERIHKQEGWLLKALAELVACAELQRRKENERMQLKQKYIDLVEQTSDWVWEVDVRGVFTFVNGQVESVTGYKPSEMIGKSPFGFMVPGYVDSVKQRFFDSVRDGRPFKDLENRFIHKDGQVVYFETSGVPVLNSWGRVKGFRGISRDITDRKSVESELKESEKKHREILASIEEGYYEVNAKGSLINFNNSTCRITGYTRNELKGMNYKQLYVDYRSVFRAFRQVYKTGQPNRGFIHQIRRKDGRICYGEVSVSTVRDREGSFLGFRGVLRDVTGRVQNQKRLAYLSMHDKLTGVYNRTYFEEELKRLRNSRDYPISMIYADVNGLKVVNDAFGHEKGDAILKAAAKVLRKSLRSREVLSRIGGDEFAAVLPNTDQVNGQRVVMRIREKIELYNESHQDIPLSLSIGLATADTNETSMGELFKVADDLMYRDKMFRDEKFCFKLLEKTLTSISGSSSSDDYKLKRYVSLCQAMGRVVGLDSQRQSMLLMLAKAHNIGNAGTPLRIMLKQGELTEEEKKVVRMHPEKGYRIAMASQELSDIADLILKHHEWWDGSGYPLGLKGENIPLECRILAVVDAFINMTTARVYRNACSNAEALAELNRCAGTQFDPALVRSFVKLHERSSST